MQDDAEQEGKGSDGIEGVQALDYASSVLLAG